MGGEGEGGRRRLCWCKQFTLQLFMPKAERERQGGRRLGQTFGALITSMRKCFKCDRSQKRRRLLSGNAVKGSQHFALPARALSHSLSCSLSASFLRHLCAMASRRHFVFRITMEHGMRKVTACCGKSFDVGAEENA